MVIRLWALRGQYLPFASRRSMQTQRKICKMTPLCHGSLRVSHTVKPHDGWTPKCSQIGTRMIWDRRRFKSGNPLSKLSPRSILLLIHDARRSYDRFLRHIDLINVINVILLEFVVFCWEWIPLSRYSATQMSWFVVVPQHLQTWNSFVLTCRLHRKMLRCV
jgi:hypothetical protein